MAKEIKNENEVAVASAVSKVEAFLENNKKAIWGIVGAIIVLAGIGYACYKFVYTPKKAEAVSVMYKAEANFRAENYELALKGDENVMGFEQIISEYGKKAGKAVYLYAAICEMKAGNAESALKYLSGYNTGDQIMAGRAEALKGDAYCNLDDNAKAAACYEKAARISDNVFSATYLLKAGQAYEALGKYDKALAAYKTIKDQYPQSFEAYEIDKDIARAENAPRAE